MPWSRSKSNDLSEPKSSLVIRFAQESDVDELLALVGELAAYERLEHECQTDPIWFRESLFGEHRYAEALLAEVKGEVVGMALFFHGFSTFLGRPTLYLEDLFVRPRYRKQGIGRALLSRLAQIAVERGCCRLEWSVLDWNQPAAAFYRALGAQPLSDWTVWRITGDSLATLAQLYPGKPLP